MQWRRRAPPASPVAALAALALVCCCCLCGRGALALSCYCTTNKGDANCDRGFCHEQQTKSGGGDDGDGDGGKFACAAVKIKDATHLACVRSATIGPSQTICKQIGPDVTACWCTTANYCNRDLMRRALIEDENGGRADGVDGGATDVLKGTEPGFRIETETYLPHRPVPTGGQLERPPEARPPARPQHTPPTPRTTTPTAWTTSTPKRLYPARTVAPTRSTTLTTTPWNPSSRSRYWWLDRTNPPSLLIPDAGGGGGQQKQGGAEVDAERQWTLEEADRRRVPPKLFEEGGERTEARTTQSADTRYAGRLTTPTEATGAATRRVYPTTTVRPRAYLHKTIRTWVWTKAQRPYTTPSTTTTSTTTRRPWTRPRPRPTTTRSTSTSTTSSSTTTTSTTTSTSSTSTTPRPTTTWTTTPSSTTSTTPTSYRTVARTAWSPRVTTTWRRHGESSAESSSRPQTHRPRVFYTTTTRRVAPPAPARAATTTSTTTARATTPTATTRRTTTPPWIDTGSWSETRQRTSAELFTAKTIAATPLWQKASTDARRPVTVAPTTSTTWSWYQRAATRRRPSWWAPDTSTRSTTTTSATPRQPKGNWLVLPKPKSGAAASLDGAGATLRICGVRLRLSQCLLAAIVVLLLRRLRLA